MTALAFKRLTMWISAVLGLVQVAPARGSETQESENGLYHLYRINPENIPQLQQLWQDDEGKALGDFNGLSRYLKKRGQKLVFATNAGIYERGPKPCGLTICNGKEEVPLNLEKGEGNF